MTFFTLLSSPAGGEQSPLGSLLPIILMFAVVYFLMIRPQMKRSKQQKKFREGLKKGDKVLTAGGIHGTIDGISETTAKVKIADNTIITAEKATLIARGEQSEPAKK